MLSIAIDRISRFFYHEHLGLFVLRLTTGAIFVVHGAMKIGNAPLVAHFFASIGLNPGMEWAWFIGLVEVLGGAALIFGVATRFFGAVLGVEMLAAIAFTGIGRGFGPHEFELILAAASFAIALIGSGSWSLYPMECPACKGFLCEGGRCVPLE